MPKKAVTLHDKLGNDLLPSTNASITFMDNGNSVQSEILDLKLKAQYNKGHYTTEQELLTAYPYPIANPLERKGWYAIVGETDTVWIWDIEGNKWVNSGSTVSAVTSVNGEDGEVILNGGNINATATIDTTSKTELINTHLTDIYKDLNNKLDKSDETVVKTDTTQTIKGLKIFTDTIGLANTSEGTVDQIKHINNNFLITSGTGQNLLNIDEGLNKISAFNRELAYEDEIAQIQGNYVTNDVLSQKLQEVTNTIPTKTSELENDSNFAIKSEIPTNNNQLENGAGYQTQEEVNNIVNNLTINMLTTENYGNTLNSVYQAKGNYATTEALNSGLDSKQDTLNDTQLQAVNSGATSINISKIATNESNINTINSKIPSQASSTNQLADKNFVNSSLNSITAFYITKNADGEPFNTKSELINATTYYSGGEVRVPTRNDYAIVLKDESNNNATTRYIYYNQWEFQYTVNETALTAVQLSAINSGITSELVDKISSNEQSINSINENYVSKSTTINNKPLSSNITLNASDVDALPSSTVIPTVNNGTLTIQKNGTQVGTFTANQSTNSTINIAVPTAINELNQSDNYRTVTDTQIEEWNNKSDFSGSYNDLTNKPTIPTNYVTTNTDQDIDGNKTFINKSIKFTNPNDILEPNAVWEVSGSGSMFNISKSDALGNVADTILDINAGLGKISLNAHELIMDNDKVYQFAENEYNKSLNLLKIDSVRKSVSGLNVTISDKIYISGSSSTNGTIEFNRIRLEPNTTYTLKVINQTGKINNDIYFWDYTNNNISYASTSLNNLNGYNTFTTASNVGELGLNVGYSSSMGNIDISFNIMLVKGNIIPTEYVPYYGSIVHQKDLDFKLLWSGNSASFGAQKILISNMSNYQRGFMLKFKDWNDASSAYTWIYGKLGDKLSIVSNMGYNWQVNDISFDKREIIIETDGISVSDVTRYQQGQSSIMPNNSILPSEIFGLE